jgi:pimeloyl-ACP methyl ester carboxylesterase
MTAASMPQMPGVRHEWAELNGVRTHYAEAGSGKPIVLMHGWPENWWSWRHVIGPLAEPDCGHFIAEERPDWVLDRVLPFLE